MAEQRVEGDRGDEIRVGDVAGSDAVAVGRGAIAVTAGGDAAVYQAGRDVHVHPGRAAARDRRNKLLLLRKVREFWITGVLETSVHGPAPIELNREARTDAVEHAWDAVIQTPGVAAPPSSPGVPLIEVFEAAGQALLILGAPGAGKTTTLLELARDAATRAEDDPAAGAAAWRRCALPAAVTLGRPAGGQSKKSADARVLLSPMVLSDR